MVWILLLIVAILVLPALFSRHPPAEDAARPADQRVDLCGLGDQPPPSS